MCGLIFQYKVEKSEIIRKAIEKQARRGPDNISVMQIDQLTYMAHNRLAIIDPSAISNQPLNIENRYYIVFNGEIYNYKAIKSNYNIKTTTNSDTEVLLRAYIEHGEIILNQLIGMFSFVIYDKLEKTWVASRDQFGIKPLYYTEFADGGIVFASEVSALLEYGNFQVDSDSVEEWKKFRRPALGYTFYDGIKEFPAGCTMRNGHLERYFHLEPSEFSYSDEQFESLLRESIQMHTVSDVPIASLISGGVDSNVVALLSGVRRTYTTGLHDNNEGAVVRETNIILKKDLTECYFSSEQLEARWRELVSYKREPIYVPNEALISLICQEINEKVVLTGEGADELLFGYTKIFSAAHAKNTTSIALIENYYSYSDAPTTDRMHQYIERLSQGKSPIDFIEDFFIDFHLSCLLRRMDFSSMFASKEARVPFVSRKLFEYMYRQPFAIRAKEGGSKYVLRKILAEAEILAPLNVPKIGFEAKSKNQSQRMHYEVFQSKILKELKW